MQNKVRMMHNVIKDYENKKIIIIIKEIFIKIYIF